MCVCVCVCVCIIWKYIFPTVCCIVSMKDFLMKDVYFLSNMFGYIT